MILNKFLGCLYYLLGTTWVVGATMTTYLGIWILMEMNMAVFTTILVSSLKWAELPNKGSGMVYFLMQSLGSSTLLLSLMLPWGSGGWPWLLGMVGVLLKLGAFPFHKWYLYVLSRCEWGSFVVLSSLQKGLPLLMISPISGMGELVMLGVLSGITGMFLSVGEMSLKKVLALSSVFNVGWLILLSKSMQPMMVLLVAYFVSLTIIVSFLSEASFNVSFAQLGRFSGLAKGAIGMSFLSLGGFPPSMGFWAKLLALQALIFAKMAVPAFFMLVMSLGMMYMYLGILMQGLSMENASVVSVSSSKWALVGFSTFVLWAMPLQ